MLDMAPGMAWTRAGGIDRKVIDAAFRARRFARQVIAPVALDIDARMARDHDYFPWDVVRAGAREGWLSSAIPKGWGGQGASITEVSVGVEEMCAVDAGVANIFGAHGLGMLPLLLSLDVDLSARVLGHVARAELDERPIICAFAITEPGGGSDVEEAEGLSKGDVQSWAERVGGGYRLNGRKVFISNGSVADYTVFYAALDRKDPLTSWTAFVVERGLPGFRCARVEAKMGQRGCPAAEIELDDVIVPANMVVGGENQAWAQTRQVLAVSRGPVGAIAVGTARGAYECAVEWARTNPLEPWQEDRLAEMVVRLRAGRAAYIEAANHCDQVLLPAPMVQNAAAVLGRFELGRRAVGAMVGAISKGSEEAWAHQCVLGSVAKVAGSDAAMAVTTSVLDIIPPWAGLVRKRAEKAFRDAKLTQIYEGTNQINRRSIAHETFRRPADPV